MTPERAAELAYGIFPLALLPDSELEYMAEALKHCILAACEEQKDQDARIMDEAADDVAEWGAYAPAYFQDKWNLRKTIQKWKDRAKAIRSGE